MNIRSRIAAGTATVIIASTGIAASMAAANASGTPPVSTTTKTEVLVSPRCYHLHQVTKTWMHWSSAAGKYIPYTLAPRTTITDYTSCHA